MTRLTILAATWSDGLFVFAGETRLHELAGHAVRGLARDQYGDALVIVDGHALRRRTHEGAWNTIATSALDLACLLPVGDVIYVGTDDARVLRVNSDGTMNALTGFDIAPGRDTWYAGSALINGERVGPPLGVRSMTATADGAALLVNVHVGGIARSLDGGISWQPTLEVRNDVHEICAHPEDPRTVVAAAATGVWISRDSGATWTVETEGLHASYCSAVAFLENDILVSASTDHFADRGAVYRRPMYARGSLQHIGGLPEWFDGIVDTACIATRANAMAIADSAGSLYVSEDAGHTWLHREHGLPTISGVLLI